MRSDAPFRWNNTGFLFFKLVYQLAEILKISVLRVSRFHRFYRVYKIGLVSVLHSFISVYSVDRNYNDNTRAVLGDFGV